MPSSDLDKVKPLDLPAVESQDLDPSEIRPFVFADVGDEPTHIEPADIQAAVEAEPEPNLVSDTQLPEPADEAVTTADLDEAEKRGYQRGLEEAQRLVAEETKQITQTFETSMSNLDEAMTRTEQALAEDSVRLAIMVAQKILRRQLSDDAGDLLSSVLSAIELTDGKEPLRIVAHPDSAARIQENMTALQQTGHADQIEISEDERLEVGDFMLHRGPATLDARLTTRLKRIEQALYRELGLEVSQ